MLFFLFAMEGDEPFDDEDAVGMEYVVSANPPQSNVADEAAGANKNEEPKAEADTAVSAPKEDEEVDAMDIDTSEHVGLLSVSLYSLNNYTFGNSSRKRRQWRTFAHRMLDRKIRYDAEGAMRVTVEVVMLAHTNSIPHVLLLRSSNPGVSGTVFSLPHTRVRIGEDNVTSINRCLNEIVKTEKEWNIVAQIGRWIRPDFARHVYPYELPHASHPKVEGEERGMFLFSCFCFVHLIVRR